MCFPTQHTAYAHGFNNTIEVSASPVFPPSLTHSLTHFHTHSLTHALAPHWFSRSPLPSPPPTCSPDTRTGCVHLEPRRLGELKELCEVTMDAEVLVTLRVLHLDL